MAKPKVEACVGCIHLLGLEFDGECVTVYCDIGGPGPPPDERCHPVPADRDTIFVFGEKEEAPDG